MTKRDVDREAVEAAAMRLAAAVMRHDLTVAQFWALLEDPTAAEAVDNVAGKTAAVVVGTHGLTV